MMYRRFLSFLASVMAFLSVLSMQAQEASIFSPKNEYAFEEVIKVEYSFNAKADSASQPNFEDFMRISGPNRSNSTTYTNGKIESSIRLSYALRAKEGGKCTLPSLTFWLDGKAYPSKKLKIKIEEGQLTQDELFQMNQRRIFQSTQTPLGSKRIVLHPDEGFIELYSELGWNFLRALTAEEFESLSDLN